MASESDDTIGCVLGVIALIAGGVWLYNNYEIKERPPEPPAPIITPLPKPVVSRPTGDIVLSTTDSGSKWILDADSVSGPRTARQGWVTIDASKDKTVTTRTSKTLYLVDCDTTAARVLSMVVYGASDAPVSSESHDPKAAKVDYYPPNTMGGGVVRKMCSTDFDL